MADKKTVFETLNAINVNDKTEQKNGLTYLSWAWAWAEVKKLYPNAQYKVYEQDNGVIYWHDNKTAWVKTGVTIEDLEHIEYLPIMNYSNKSIAVDDITSFNVNKSIQRSLTKALARHGLGLYIYAGEDLPQPDEEPKKDKKQAQKANKKANDNFLDDAKVGEDPSMTNYQKYLALKKKAQELGVSKDNIEGAYKLSLASLGIDETLNFSKWKLETQTSFLEEYNKNLGFDVL